MPLKIFVKLLYMFLVFFFFTLNLSASANVPAKAHEGGNPIAKIFDETFYPCLSRNNDLNFCLIKTLYKFKPFMLNGYPALDIDVLDPLNFDDVEFNLDKAVVRFKSAFTNLVLRGLSNFYVEFVEFKFQKGQMHLMLTIPEVVITGMYTLSGKLMNFKFDQNHGGFDTVLRQINVTGSALVVNYTDEFTGIQRLKLVDLSVDVAIGDIELDLHNLFSDYTILRQTLLTALNGNSQFIFQQAKPEIKVRLEKLLLKIINRTLSKLDAEQFLKVN